ncbi:TRAP transporter substrate-binding protein [Halalkalibacter kiskunsagensis]
MKGKQRPILLMVVVVALMILMAACGGAQTSQDVERSESNGETSSEEKAADDGKTYTIKMATPSTPSDSNVMAFLEFEKIVEERSNGKIDVNVMHSGQLGGHTDYIDGLQMGSIQAAEINTSILEGINDKFMIFGMPYISRSMEHQRDVLANGVGDQLSNALQEQTGIQITGWMIRGPRIVYSSKGAIETADDFKGLKVRVMESPIMIKTMELLGAKPTPISADERYMALQTGVVDAAENSIALIVTEKEYEVTDYVSLTEHFITPNVIAFDTKFLDKLPEDLKQIVLEASEEAAAFAFEEEVRQIEEAAKTLEEHGMKINSVDDKSTFIEAVEPIYDEYQDIIGQDLLDAFLNE